MDYKEKFDKQFKMPSRTTRTGFEIHADIEFVKEFIDSQVIAPLQEKHQAEIAKVIKDIEYDILNNKHSLSTIFEVTRSKYLK
jgi:hypothetical protein